MGGPLIAAQSSCAHRKDTGAFSCQPWPQDQAAASGPVSSTKTNTRFPLRTWLCTSCLITEWMRLLQREKASCRLCSQLFCSFSGPFPIFSCCVSSTVMCILKCTCCTALAHGPLCTWHGLRKLHTLEPSLVPSAIYQHLFNSTTGYPMHCYMEYKTWPLLSRCSKTSVDWKKKKKWTTLKLRIILYNPESLSQKTASQIVLRNCLGEVREEPGYIGVLQQKPGNWSIKRLLLVKENQTSQMNVWELFYVWEDARVWAHWNHSFEVHLSYLRPVFGSVPPWIPSGGKTGGLFSSWWLDGHILCLLIMAGNLLSSH